MYLVLPVKLWKRLKGLLNQLLVCIVLEVGTIFSLDDICELNLFNYLFICTVLKIGLNKLKIDKFVLNFSLYQFKKSN